MLLTKLEVSASGRGPVNNTLTQQANFRATPGEWGHRGTESQSSHQAIRTLWPVCSYEVSSAPIKKNCLHFICSGNMTLFTLSKKSASRLPQEEAPN